MKAILFLVGLGLILSPAAQAEEETPYFTMALASDTPREGYQPAAYLNPPEKGPSELYVESQPRFTTADIEKAQRSPDAQGLPAVYVTFTEESGQRMLAFTKTAIGEKMAILIEGKVLTAPVIRGAFGGSFQISGGNLSRQEAQEIADAINQAAKNAKNTKAP